MSRLFIFDLDDTLIHEGIPDFVLCEDTLEILQKIKLQGDIVALATHNQDAERIIGRLDIAKYISHVDSVYDASCKVTNIRRIIARYPDARDPIFYDDLSENVEAVQRRIGIRARKVSWRTGITIHDFVSSS